MKLKKNNLILFTGFIWLWACVVLLFRSFLWMQLFESKELYTLLLIGVAVAFIKTYLIFRKLNLRNINRIYKLKNKFVSIFKFHLPKDQILIVVMIVGGSFLRKSDLLPKSYLLPIYFGIGLAMFYSSFLYFKFYIKNYKNIS
jgi:hypothetical protein